MIDCGCDEILLPQGSDGVNGKNAYTVTTAQFVQPGIGNSITINVSDSLQNTNQWAIAGQIIKITDSVGNGGWYRVTGITGTTQITATQLDYPGTSGSAILVGAGVSPAGLQGPAGEPGTPGGQGPAGDPNSLSIPPGNVTTLAPGQPATATISGFAPNQTLSLGIPQGIPGTDGLGKTLQWQYINNASVTVPNGTTFFAIVPPSGFDSNGSLCPNDGDAFRATFFASAVAITGGGSGGARFIGSTFNIQLQLAAGAGTNQNIEYLSNDTAYNDTVNMWSLPVFALNPTVLTTDPVTFFKFELILQRITSTTAKYFLSWMSTDPASRPSLSGFYCNNISFNFNTTAVKQIQVNALGTGGDVRFSRMSLIIEKITI